MKIFVIASLLLLGSLSHAAEKPKLHDEKNLDEVLASGYAFMYFTDVNGADYLCYGEVNKMDFEQKTSCKKVKATFDRVTNRPSKIIYLDTDVKK